MNNLLMSMPNIMYVSKFNGQSCRVWLWKKVGGKWRLKKIHTDLCQRVDETP